MRADRLVATLLILQRRGRVTAGELARELEVSEKTARRDLEALGMAGLPVYSQPGRGGGWQLLGGASTDLTGLTADEARNLFLAAGTSSSTTIEMRNAMRKLLGALPESFRDDAEVASQAVVVDPAAWGAAAPAPPPEHLPALQRAVIERRRIELGYVDRTRTVTQRLADPLGLVSKGTVWYLVAGTEHGRRTFRVSRIRSVVITDERVERPAGFDLRAAWQEIVTTVGERRLPVRATILIDASFVPALRAQFGDDMMLAEMDGSTADGRELVIVGGPSTHVIAQHLAGWGGLVEVVEPIEVRAHLVRVARELLRTYRASPDEDAMLVARSTGDVPGVEADDR
jgi:predicted DNA-binding transcriptional regulator YafY